MLQARWVGAMISFKFMGCPLCKRDIAHPGLEDLTAPLEALRVDVGNKALMRLKYDGQDKHPDIVNKYNGDAKAYAMNLYAYYQCFKCSKAYYGGGQACGAADQAGNFDPSELLCGGCSPIASQECPKHGRDYLEFKCRFCCSVAVWFCFGTTHFCEPCHNNHSPLCQAKVEDLVQCPCKPVGNNNMPAKVEGDCPLGIAHPPSGTEFALGCGICRNVQSF